MSSERLPHVMILGCGRSGTSIFGELFNHLSDYRYVSEPSFADFLQVDFSIPQAVKVPHESRGFEAPPGLSFPPTVLFERLPDLRIFWIVRHPLDAVCSLRIGIAQDWGHHPRPPDWRDWLNRPLVERCAHHWAYLNAVGYAHVEQCATVVRFEDMIADPFAFATSVTTDIGLKSGQYAAELQAWAKRVQNTNNADFVEAETSRPYSRADHTVRVGRWRENLKAADIEAIRPIIEEPARTFGYALP